MKEKSSKQRRQTFCIAEEGVFFLLLNEGLKKKKKE